MNKKFFASLTMCAVYTAGVLLGGLQQTDFFRDFTASAVEFDEFLYRDVNTDNYGDINEDGKVNIADIAYIQEYVKGSRTFSIRERIYADLNADEEVDEDDIAIISDIYTDLNSSYVSSCKNAWYKKYSSNTYGSLTFRYLDDGTIAITNCDSFASSVIIPQKINGFPVSTIGGYAFAATNPSSVIIPEGVTMIGSDAFRSCTKLKSISLPNSLIEIGWGAFYGSGLTSIVIPDSVKIIGDWAFCECRDLVSVTFGKSVIEIGELAFRDSGITSVEFPNSLKRIGGQAFCVSNLKEVTIPASVETIEQYAGYETFYCDTITIENPNCVIDDGALEVNAILGYQNSTAEKYALRNGISFFSLTTETYAGIEYALYSDHAEVVSCSSSANTINIMSSVGGVPVTKIANEGLASGSFQSVILPSSITSIGDRAFWNCSNLINIKFPNSVTTIGESAFVNCSSLKSVDFSTALTEIGSCAFWLCNSLESVTIPESVEKIENRAFLNCNNLSEITVLNRECEFEIYDSSESLAVIPQWTIIYGYSSSTAKDYANEYNRTFISLDPVISGDVNNDGSFNVSDVVLLQKWILAVPNTKLADWKAGDLCEDGRLDVFDLCLMKSELLQK